MDTPDTLEAAPESESPDVLDRIIKGAGGYMPLCEALGIKPQSLYKWRKSGVPAERVLPCERISRVPRHEIRGDLYPPPGSEGDQSLPQSGTSLGTHG